jgi:hypothetical protein
MKGIVIRIGVHEILFLLFPIFTSFYLQIFQKFTPFILHIFIEIDSFYLHNLFTSAKIPLIPNIRRSPKLYLLDTGIVNYAAGIRKEIFDSRMLTDAYEGKIAEHIVGQELTVLLNSLVHSIYFWTRESTDASAEVDFVYQHEGLIFPLEVKSGKTGKLRSLHEFTDSTDHQYAVKVSSGKLSIEKAKTRSGKDFYLLNLPFYLVCKLDHYLTSLIEGRERYPGALRFLWSMSAIVFLCYVNMTKTAYQIKIL